MEKAQLQAHEESVDSTLAAVKARADRQREADAMRKRQDTLAAIDVKELRVRSIEEEIKDLDRSIALESAKRISNAPQLRARQNEKKQALDALRADISRLKASL